MSDLDDLDSFIENIEQTAPKESEDAKFLRCQECDTALEEVDEVWVCPNCGAQATNILQLEETELNYDELGRPIVGDRVRVGGKKKKKSEDIDYGWAWSTDDAISHILSLQVTALERAGLLPSFFREAVTNMWFRFWLDYIAPFIQDQYSNEDLVQIKAKKALKLRDIEVLVKVQDKVMIPKRLLHKDQQQQAKNSKPRARRMLGIGFFPHESLPSCLSLSASSSSESSSDDGSFDSKCNSNSLPPQVDADPSSIIRPMDGVEDDHTNDNNPDLVTEKPSHDNDSDDMDLACQSMNNNPRKKSLTATLDRDSITILTLNRTLAFIEAASRCTEQNDPLFAADIIRACNYRLIPFYGAHKTIPDGMKLNARDRLMFQKTRPPTTDQLTIATTLLIQKIYRNQLPKYLPVPSMDAILERYIKDLNLPYDLYSLIKSQFTFFHFNQTRPMKLCTKTHRILPHYDRWAYAVLVWHLKNLFHLGDKYINKQRKKAKTMSRQDNINYFKFGRWLQQMSMRMKIILTYDPFVLLHPLASAKDFQTTPQMLKYIETLISDRIPSEICVYKRESTEYDLTFRNELTQFLCNEMPRPLGFEKLNDYLIIDQELDKTVDIKHPITDSLRRTKKYWLDQIKNNEDECDIVMRDFSHEKIFTLDNLPDWTYDEDLVKKTLSRRIVEVDPNWPSALKLLMLVGSFICHCRPRDLMIDIFRVESSIYPRKRTCRRRISQEAGSPSDSSKTHDDNMLQ